MGVLLLLVHTLSVSSLQLKKLRFHNTSANRPIKCQSRSWSQRGAKVNGSPHHSDSSLLKSIGIQIATNSLPGPTSREHRKLIGVLNMLRQKLEAYAPPSPPSFFLFCPPFFVLSIPDYPLSLLSSSPTRHPESIAWRRWEESTCFSIAQGKL